MIYPATVENMCVASHGESSDYMPGTAATRYSAEYIDSRYDIVRTLVDYIHREHYAYVDGAWAAALPDAETARHLMWAVVAALDDLYAAVPNALSAREMMSEDDDSALNIAAHTREFIRRRFQYFTLHGPGLDEFVFKVCDKVVRTPPVPDDDEYIAEFCLKDIATCVRINGRHKDRGYGRPLEVLEHNAWDMNRDIGYFCPEPELSFIYQFTAVMSHGSPVNVVRVFFAAVHGLGKKVVYHVINALLRTSAVFAPSQYALVTFLCWSRSKKCTLRAVDLNIQKPSVARTVWAIAPHPLFMHALFGISLVRGDRRPFSRCTIEMFRDNAWCLAKYAAKYPRYFEHCCSERDPMLLSARLAWYILLAAEPLDTESMNHLLCNTSNVFNASHLQCFFDSRNLAALRWLANTTVMDMSQHLPAIYKFVGIDFPGEVL